MFMGNMRMVICSNAMTRAQRARSHGKDSEVVIVIVIPVHLHDKTAQ